MPDMDASQAPEVLVENLHKGFDGKPVLTADTEAVRSVLTSDDGVFTVPAGDVPDSRKPVELT